MELQPSWKTISLPDFGMSHLSFLASIHTRRKLSGTKTHESACRYHPPKRQSRATTKEIGQPLVRDRRHRIVRLCLFLCPKGSCRPFSSDRACKFSRLPANACHKMAKENRLFKLLGTPA